MDTHTVERMGKDSSEMIHRSKTLPPSPTHSSSSSDFEFIVSVSPRKSSSAAADLFYKGQLLPLHLSPRLSMLRLLSSSDSSSSTSATASRDSTASSSSTDSSDLVLLAADARRPSKDDSINAAPSSSSSSKKKKPNKYHFSLTRFFKKEHKPRDPDPAPLPDPDPGLKRPSSGKSHLSSSSAREMIRKYMKKVKPLCEKLSPYKQQQQEAPPTKKNGSQLRAWPELEAAPSRFTFSGNLSRPIRRSARRCSGSSCPSSALSSPIHSGALSSSYGLTGAGLDRIGVGGGRTVGASATSYADASTIEELQSAIEGAIAHCKNSMLQNDVVSPVNGDAGK